MGDPSVEVVVVHEDADVIVVDKPAGLVVHPGAGHRSGTLVHGLRGPVPGAVDAAGRGRARSPTGRGSSTGSTGARRA